MNATSKACTTCGGVYFKRPKASWKEWRKKKYCSRKCQGKGRVETPVVQRIESRLEPAGECLIWTGATTPGGFYGVIWAGSRSKGLTLVHRAIYEHYVGPIPEGWEVDHLCRVTLCANHEHLEAVTKAENLRRQASTRTHCSRGHELTEENIYRLSAHPTWRICKVCQQARSKRYYRERMQRRQRS